MAQAVSPVPIGTPVTLKNGSVHSTWVQTFTNWWQSMRTPLQTVAAPATSSSPGVEGQIAQDSNYVYHCIQSNTATQKAIWRRIPSQTF